MFASFAIGVRCSLLNNSVALVAGIEKEVKICDRHSRVSKFDHL
jgi:hypothetical protein